jgi:hypothetical protein
MEKYLDSEDEKLKKGFYKYEHSNNLFYFTGKYDRRTKDPIFENEHQIGEKRRFLPITVKRLYKIQKEEVRKILQGLKDKTNWLEKKLEK